jgi:hypothetical protein
VKLAIDKFLDTYKKEYVLKYNKNIGVLVKRQYLEINTEVKKDHQQISW